MNAASRVQDRALALRSARMACVLRARGITAGDCVAMAMPGVPELAIVAYGALRLGAVAAPLGDDGDVDALQHGLELVGARLLVAWHTLAETAEAAASRTGTEVLFVAPGEFQRLLDGAEPDRTVADREDRDGAVLRVGGAAYTVITHGEIEPGAVLA